MCQVFLFLFFFFFFFFNDTATTEIYTLSLHDALPISPRRVLRDARRGRRVARDDRARGAGAPAHRDRKSTRLNSSHGYISYAVFCLKKKKQKTINTPSITKRKSKQIDRHNPDQPERTA